MSFSKVYNLTCPEDLCLAWWGGHYQLISGEWPQPCAATMNTGVQDLYNHFQFLWILKITARYYQLIVNLVFQNFPSSITLCTVHETSDSTKGSRHETQTSDLVKVCRTTLQKLYCGRVRTGVKRYMREMNIIRGIYQNKDAYRRSYPWPIITRSIVL